MRKIAFLLILVLFSFIGCMEEEKPLTHPYGIYEVESMVSSIPVDFTNSGEQITEHVANFSWCGTSEFSIVWRLNKQTPVMDFNTFMFWDRVDEITNEREIFRGCGLTRRIVDLKEDGELGLKFFGNEGIFSDDPKRLLHQFEIKSLAYFPEDKSIRMETYQRLYDFFSEEYVETEITYLFSYAGPVFVLSN
ncbi:hypothetical protein [Pararhodonellum marinum]|uniref:hypothetical protein n=1 Tax=Pararhodonellum marinum TaxID=2755358 RepID=UPI00188DEC07|nr:hypothetical protein [Pararhodonellum marinum]